MDAFEEIEALEFTAYDHVTDLAARILLQDIEEPLLYIGYHIDDDTPVFNVVAKGVEDTFINSYRLEGLSEEAFIEEGYDVWTLTFEDTFGPSLPMEDFLNGVNLDYDDRSWFD